MVCPLFLNQFQFLTEFPCILHETYENIYKILRHRLLTGDRVLNILLPPGESGLMGEPKTVFFVSFFLFLPLHQELMQFSSKYVLKLPSQQDNNAW